MGQRYAAILQSMGDVEVVGIADPVGQASFRDHASLLAEVRPDAVIICTPDHLHRPVAVDALEAGCAVLVEKPLADTVADAEAICRAAAGRLAMVGHLLRFAPHYAAVKEGLADLGDLLFVHAHRFGTAASARVVSHLMIHDLDLIRWITGQEVAAVQAATVGASTAAAHLRLDGGALACVEAVAALPSAFAGHVWTGMTLIGTEGCVEVPSTHPSVIRHGTGVTYVDRTRIGVLGAQTATFLAAVRDGGPSPIPVEEGLAAVRLAAAVEEAAAKWPPST